MVVVDSSTEGSVADHESGEASGGLSLFTVCENGYGKRTKVEEYRPQHRAGSGLRDIRTSKRNGEVIALKAVRDEDDLVLITAQGQIMRIPVANMRPIGRNTQGVRVISLRDGDKLVSVECVVKNEDEEESITSETPDDATAESGEGESPESDVQEADSGDSPTDTK